MLTTTRSASARWAAYSRLVRSLLGPAQQPSRMVLWFHPHVLGLRRGALDADHGLVEHAAAVSTCVTSVTEIWVSIDLAALPVARSDARSGCPPFHG